MGQNVPNVDNFVVRRDRNVVWYESGSPWNASSIAAGPNLARFPPQAFVKARQLERIMIGKKKILVVDDDRVVVKALSLKLNSKGYEVLTARDGSEAISSVRQQKPDLILLDISFPPDVNNPFGDGFGVMGWLKRVDEAATIPVIIITGGSAMEYEKKAKASGAIAFFHKPIEHEDLFAVIRETLGEDSAPS